jgi:hypothetical protein
MSFYHFYSFFACAAELTSSSPVNRVNDWSCCPTSSALEEGPSLAGYPWLALASSFRNLEA